MIDINQLTSDYLKRFKITNPDTLFEPEWSALTVGRCPLCNCKLKFPQNKKIALCSSKKHRKPFIININKI